MYVAAEGYQRVLQRTGVERSARTLFLPRGFSFTRLSIHASTCKTFSQPRRVPIAVVMAFEDRFNQMKVPTFQKDNSQTTTITRGAEGILNESSLE